MAKFKKNCFFLLMGQLKKHKKDKDFKVARTKKWGKCGSEENYCGWSYLQSVKLWSQLDVIIFEKLNQHDIQWGGGHYECQQINIKWFHLYKKNTYINVYKEIIEIKKNWKNQIKPSKEKKKVLFCLLLSEEKLLSKLKSFDVFFHLSIYPFIKKKRIS